MKKNAKTIAALTREMEAKNAVLKSLQKKANSLDEEARQRVDALIAEKEAELESIKAKKEELESDETDRSEEMKALVAELSKKVEETSNMLKAMKESRAKVNNFVDSKEGMQEFTRIMSNSTSAKDFKDRWNEVLAKNNITPSDLLLPHPVLESLNDAWDKNAGDFLNLLDITGLKAIKVAYDTNEGLTSRAHGHKKGTAKEEQELTFAPKVIRAQMVYKYIQLDRVTVDFEDENGVLIQYVTRELVYRIMNEIKRAVLIGDGRNAGDNDKITEIEAIARETSDAYVTAFELTGGETILTLEEVATMVDSIEADGDIHLFVSKQQARALRAYHAAQGGDVQFRSLEEIADELGVAEIHTVKYLTPTVANQKQAVAVAFVGKAYKVVGDITMAGFQDFNLTENKYRYLTECYIGGGLALPKSGAVYFATPKA